jgi:hypothetical protein
MNKVTFGCMSGISLKRSGTVRMGLGRSNCEGAPVAVRPHLAQQGDLWSVPERESL